MLETYPHLFNKSSEVVGRLVCVFHGLKIIYISSSMVPVHYYEIHVLPCQQQIFDAMHPHWWRSCGPVPMNYEGGWSGELKLGVGGQVGVGHECTTGDIVPGVQQQPNFDARSNDCVTKI